MNVCSPKYMSPILLYFDGPMLITFLLTKRVTCTPVNLVYTASRCIIMQIYYWKMCGWKSLTDCSLFLPPFAHVISVFGPMYDFKFCRRALKTRFICLQRKSLAYYSLEPALKMKHTIFLIKRPHGNTHDSPALSYWDSALTQPCWYVLEKTQETMC